MVGCRTNLYSDKAESSIILQVGRFTEIINVCIRILSNNMFYPNSLGIQMILGSIVTKYGALWMVHSVKLD